MNTKTLVIVAILLAFAGVATASTGGAIGAGMVAAFSLVFSLNATQRNSILVISQAFAQYGDKDIRKLVYILATSWHETKLQSIKEYKAAPGTPVWENYQKKYWPSGYYGRGYAQLTWDYNYRKMGDWLGIDLLNNPDLALDPAIGAKILVYGMMNGSFTGKRLSDYINSSNADYYNARRTVNGLMVNGVNTGTVVQGYTYSVLDKIPNL
jgi:putative chitinase